jgi:hypothetical protein
LVLLYDQDRDILGACYEDKFEPLWHGPYIFKRVLEKGSYELVNYDVVPLGEPHNGIYLKEYYA